MHNSVFNRGALAPIAFSLLLALPAGAQERQLFTWTGRVDRAIQLTVRGGDAVNSRETNMQTRGRFRMASTLPRQDGVLRVERVQGRGPVNVVQQPMADNNYTAIVEVTDPEGGAEVYQVVAYWAPANGSVLGNRGRGRGYGNQRRDENDPRNGRIYAQNNVPSLRWNGEVDSVVELVWRGNSVSQRLVSGAAPRNTSTSVSGDAANARNASVVLSIRSGGRGRVEVVQQPSSSNRYTTIIRITDPEPGYGRYEFDAYWK